MFKRIIYDEWTTLIPLISFWFTFGVFMIITVRALFLRKETISRLEQLPLEDEAPTHSTPRD